MDCYAYIEKNKSNLKPLFRWTVGKNSQYNVILLESIKTFHLLYGDLADGVLVFNTDFPEKNFNCFVNFCQKYNIDCLYADENSLSIKPCNSAWKFYPPRLRIQSHEVFLDSDFVLLKKGECLLDFFQDNYAFGNTTRLIKFGDYFDELKKHKSLRGMGINGGIFGFPPNYDIKNYIEKNNKGWKNTLNQQGLTAYLVLNHKHKIIPPPTFYNFYNCNCSIITSFKCKFPKHIYKNKDYTDKMEGFHFCNGMVNQINPAWRYYMKNPFGQVNLNRDGLPDASFWWASGEDKTAILF